MRIGIIGPGADKCSSDLFNFGFFMGKQIAAKDRLFYSGGKGGFMKAVCQGLKASADTFHGQTIGILPESNILEANEFIDVHIATGMGMARNVVLINSVEVIIAAGGGAGTLSELAFAWQLGKTVICLTKFDGWAKKLAGTELDYKHKHLFKAVKSLDEINIELRRFGRKQTQSL